ncbi:MAG: DUF4118 domain-containing protein [Sphingobium sp.]
MMRGEPTSYLLAIVGVAIVAAVTATWLSVLGVASCALLFLVPVLLIAARGGVGPALVAAAGGALAYNFFLLPPRFTFRIHGFDNVVSVFVLFAVALVTSRLANALKTREAEADARAAANAQAALFSLLLGRSEAVEAITHAVAWLTQEYGEARIILPGDMPEEKEGISTLDLSAAAWAMHNGDITGHGSAIMSAADWTFLPLNPRPQLATDLLAIARPINGATRTEPELAQLQVLGRLLGQARDRAALENERHARERLEDREAFRRTLLASLAHDFRTPLTVVTGELAKLAAADHGVVYALAEARRLDRMMDDLVGAARIESGDLKPNWEPVDLVDVIADVRSSLGGLPEDVALVQNVSMDLPMVDADPVLLRHILINLIHNAARHANSSVAVTARADNDVVEIMIDDDGPGIPLDERTRIFNRFARVEGSDRTGGSGLGLAIVKGFADAMGMGVAAEPNENGGACFRLTMPVRVMNT